MNDILNKLKEKYTAQIDSIDNLAELDKVKNILFSKKGIFTELLQELKNLSATEKPVLGKLINDLKKLLMDRYENRLVYINSIVQKNKEQKEAVDITLSIKDKFIGALHPINIVKDNISDIFTSMGFKIIEGPEIELKKYNFDLLNIPDDHPARDFTDTFYITEDLLLRTQTSGVQVRKMEVSAPPIKIICPGKVYRPDDDATHSPMFHQIEGLYVDEGISLLDLKIILEQFAKIFFDSHTKVRFRPSFFPFTEPSVEVDLSCAICHGAGCNLCKGTGWLELLGAGVVNPKVLENSGIDSSKYSGFAFGIGIERAAMIKYKIPDMRMLFDNDIRFIQQFRF